MRVECSCRHFNSSVNSTASTVELSQIFTNGQIIQLVTLLWGSRVLPPLLNRNTNIHQHLHMTTFTYTMWVKVVVRRQVKFKGRRWCAQFGDHSSCGPGDAVFSPQQGAVQQFQPPNSHCKEKQTNTRGSGQ